MNDTDSEFLPLQETAARLGVPATWLKAEAEAGRVPCLHVGRRLLFKLALVIEALDQRAHESLVNCPPEVAHA